MCLVYNNTPVSPPRCIKASSLVCLMYGRMNPDSFPQRISDCRSSVPWLGVPDINPKYISGQAICPLRFYHSLTGCLQLSTLECLNGSGRVIKSANKRRCLVPGLCPDNALGGLVCYHKTGLSAASLERVELATIPGSTCRCFVCAASVGGRPDGDQAQVMTGDLIFRACFTRHGLSRHQQVNVEQGWSGR
ncbi:hypothetical protein RRG08_036355 [Elysia crispata]|uniref:Uncharacterized protein n=1 Tax=Elysia crispata TaxID=231223 RepID=A0AAE0ZJS3_9GAST|nr:hypothetical protein RRG08_036355 [Elysia crispata]